MVRWTYSSGDGNVPKFGRLRRFRDMDRPSQTWVSMLRSIHFLERFTEAKQILRQFTKISVLARGVAADARRRGESSGTSRLAQKRPVLDSILLKRH